MKHIFIINPKAGKSAAAMDFIPQIESLFAGRKDDYEIHVTTCVGDATDFTRMRCESADGEPLRFYACGGDGTLNETLQGMAECPSAALGVLPCGSGNDFVRSFPQVNFLDLASQVNADIRPIDLIRFNDEYALNMCSAGLDSDVCRNMERFKRWPLVSGSGAYILGLIYTFFGKLGKHARILLEDGRRFDLGLMILVLGNGGYYGGGWLGAPKFDVRDGQIDLCIVKKITRLRMLQIIGRYKKGLHADDATMKDCILYTRCRKLHVDFDLPTTLNMDGQISEKSTLDAEILPQGLRLIYPAPGV